MFNNEKKYNEIYNQVYDFTNENVNCLKDLYHFDNSKVLSVVGSGDQFFASILYGAKKVDLFDINETSYLYFVLKFYSIRELIYEEFYDFLIKKKIDNLNVYEKLQSVLPKEVLKYYKYLIDNNKSRKKRSICFKHDSIDLLCKSNQKYYFNSQESIIPYLIKDKYYELQKLLKKMKLPNFYKSNIMYLKKEISDNYDIMLASNIYNCVPLNLKEYTKLLNSFDIPEIEANYDWHGWFLGDFMDNGYIINKVLPSSPVDYSVEKNYIYTLRK